MNFYDGIENGVIDVINNNLEIIISMKEVSVYYNGGIF